MFRRHFFSESGLILRSELYLYVSFPSENKYFFFKFLHWFLIQIHGSSLRWRNPSQFKESQLLGLWTRSEVKGPILCGYLRTRLWYSARHFFEFLIFRRRIFFWNLIAWPIQVSNALFFRKTSRGSKLSLHHIFFAFYKVREHRARKKVLGCIKHNLCSKSF